MNAGSQNPYEGATNQELQLAQANQDFWNQAYSQFNPQTPVVSTPTSAPAFNNVAKGAQGVLGANLKGQSTGTANIGQAGQNLQNTATGQSKTEDLNSFMQNFGANNQAAEQRELSMFGGMQGQNAKNQELFQTLPEEKVLGEAKTKTDINNLWNDYENGQGNPANTIGSAVGGFGGTVAGSLASKKLFGNGGNQESDEETT